MSIHRRKELGNFLRYHRERLSPSDIGLPESRRRTPGLKREEVASSAGISLTWYTWLEQGRSIEISEKNLTNIAEALLLNRRETDYVFLLARKFLGHDLPVIMHTIEPSIQNFLDSMVYSPAFVLDTYWNIIAWNKTTEIIFCELWNIPPAERNLILVAFTNAEFREKCFDWKDQVSEILASFRFSSTHLIDSEWFANLLNKLIEEYPDFHTCWLKYDVLPDERIESKIVKHPILGKLTYEYTSVILPRINSADFKIYINNPIADTLAITKPYIDKCISLGTVS